MESVKIGIGFPFAGLCEGELRIIKCCLDEEDTGSITIGLSLRNIPEMNLRDLMDNGNKMIFLDTLLSLNLNIKDFGFYFDISKKEFSLEINGKSPVQTENKLNSRDSVSQKPLLKGGDDGEKFDDHLDLANLVLPTYWLPMKKTLGPLDIKQVGISLDLQHGEVWFPIDASFSLSALSFGLNGFEVGVPLGRKGLDIKLGGLSLAFRSGPVEISGGFIKVKDSPEPEYLGEALVKFEKLSISAMGSYSTVNNKPSLFVFALVSYPLGGPPCFFVTGFAAGFGYNRTLKIPEIEDLMKFPLVSYATSKEKISISKIAADMSEYIPPSAGDFWLAAGVKFTSFNMIESFALLTINFGTKFEVALLGRSIMDVPSVAGSSGLIKAAHAELLIKVKFDPENGVVAATGILGSNSYILSKDCRVSGGFAFYTWFNGKNEGDFVLSLGGYHPSFTRPEHYPIVPRFALNWNISRSLSITGSGYFALTPSSAMAGGALQAIYHEGNLNASFTVQADFYFGWKPIHYDINAGIHVKASYLVNYLFGKKLFNFELWASAHLWGPEFSGEVYVKWSFISFTIRFGEGYRKPQPLIWKEFCESFLPKDNNGKIQPINIMIARGLLKEANKDDKIIWAVNPFDFSVSINSSIPWKSIKVNGKPKECTNPEISLLTSKKVSIKPMDEDNTHKNFESVIEVKIIDSKGNPMDGEKFDCLPIIKNMPKAIWISDKPIEGAEIEKFPVGLQLELIKPNYAKDIVTKMDEKNKKNEPKEIHFIGAAECGCELVDSEIGGDIKGKYALLENAVIVNGSYYENLVRLLNGDIDVR